MGQKPPTDPPRQSQQNIEYAISVLYANPDSTSRIQYNTSIPLFQMLTFRHLLHKSYAHQWYLYQHFRFVPQMHKILPGEQNRSMGCCHTLAIDCLQGKESNMYFGWTVPLILRGGSLKKNHLIAGTAPSSGQNPVMSGCRMGHKPNNYNY